MKEIILQFNRLKVAYQTSGQSDPATDMQLIMLEALILSYDGEQ